MTNFADRTIRTGNNLDILRGLNPASVDLIYLDPPFNSNATTLRRWASPRLAPPSKTLGHYPILTWPGWG